jgi:hypothetical protein
MTAPSGPRLAREAAYHRRRQGEVSDPAMQAYHRGRADMAVALLIQAACCRRCGRELTNPASRRRGIGPECARRR